MTRVSATVIVLMVLALGVLHTDAAACCRKYTKGMIPKSIIKGYSIQTITGYCHINAVIFHTNGGRNVCTDPSKGWVMDNIRKLREKVQAISKKNSKA